jgi:hypothetical protein
MTQALYAHMNNNKKKKIGSVLIPFQENGCFGKWREISGLA